MTWERYHPVLSRLTRPPQDDANNLSVGDRTRAGYSEGKRSAADIIISLQHSGGVITESVKLVAHSMGAAYTKGFAKALVEYAQKNPSQCQGLSITEYDFASFQQEDQAAIFGVPLYQYDNKGDGVVDGMFGFLLGSKHAREAGAQQSTEDVNSQGGHSLFDFVPAINSLPQGKYIFKDGKFVPY